MGNAYFCEKTVDDLLRVALSEIIANGRSIHSTQGSNSEITGVLLELTNPRARLSRTATKGRIFSCLGELLWYLSGSDKLDFIEYYLSIYRDFANDGRVLGAYGPRLFSGMPSSQMSNVVSWLKNKRKTRRAVVQIFSGEDLKPDQNDIPCTCTLQFLIRDDLLDLIVTMRSNDVTRGFTHDVFCFTMLQEIVARQLCIEPGNYKHFVGSLHLYDEQGTQAEHFIEEGWQSTRAQMAEMPRCDPWPSIKKLLDIERLIRTGGRIIEGSIESLDPYWIDLAVLLQIFRHSKDKDHQAVEVKMDSVADSYFRPYIERLLPNV